MTREDISPQNVGTSQTTSKKSKGRKTENSKRNTHCHHYKNQEKLPKNPKMKDVREAEVDPHHHQDKNTQ